jgi:hypothetical protein
MTYIANIPGLNLISNPLVKIVEAEDGADTSEAASKAWTLACCKDLYDCPAKLG